MSVDQLTLVASNVTVRSDPSSAVIVGCEVLFAVPAGSLSELAAYNAELGVSPTAGGVALSGAVIAARAIFPGSPPGVFGSGDRLLVADNLPGVGQANSIFDGAGLFRAEISVAPGVAGQFALPLSNVYLIGPAGNEFPVDLVGGVLTVLAAPSVSIADAALPEGDAGSTEATFTVTLSAPSDQPITVDYATVDGTARANEDYQPRSGTLGFAPGELTQSVAVPVIGDSLDEPNESFSVILSNASHATIGRGQATGTIIDDDPRPAGLDADGNGAAEALSDGMLILRYLFDPGGTWPIDDVLGVGATRVGRDEIRSFLDGVRLTCLDADGNGAAEPLSDGILILRYLFDPSGSWSVADALGAGATRTSVAAIKTYLDQWTPRPQAVSDLRTTAVHGEGQQARQAFDAVGPDASRQFEAAPAPSRPRIAEDLLNEIAFALAASGQHEPCGLVGAGIGDIQNPVALDAMPRRG